VLFSFSTVINIFVSDFEGIDKVVSVIASWLKLQNQQLNFLSLTFACFLIFVLPKRGKGFDKKLATTTFLKQLYTVICKDKMLLSSFKNKSLTNVKFEKLLQETAFKLQLLVLPAKGDKQYITLFQNRLLYKLEEAYMFYTVAKITFSACYFQAFLKYACLHFAKNIVEPFNFV
jgi:hypothetical protein